LANKLVLIVEGNPAIREALGMLLEDELAGASTVGVGDFSSAVKLAHNLRPATIVLDLKLDGIDGYTLASRLRSHAQTGGVPLIAIAAATSKNIRTRAIAAGCDAVCSARRFDRRHDTGKIVRTVRAYLGGRSSVTLNDGS
jgi:CheY-like chemotaxis protein